ncbi:hypothetical protein [Streptomyces sp. MS2.AVA.5]|uniref:Uncharacterized protein n=1 Tax=Streptomyces achmelvichensis TaxID=3134111 RepID=A0ACC6PLI9_9ACTN
MTSVMGLLEERETVARVRAEELRAEAERVLAELSDAEAVLERRVIARVELAEALAAPAAGAEVGEPRRAAVEPVAQAKTAPVAGSVVPRRHPGMPVEVLAVGYRRIVELMEGDVSGGEGMSAKELTGRLGLEVVPAKIEGVRSKARRLAERDWLDVSPTGRFTPRQPTGTALTGPDGQGGGS